MLIICNDEERDIIRRTCNGECDGCVFKDVRCPVERDMIYTNEGNSRRKDWELNTIDPSDYYEKYENVPD